MANEVKRLRYFTGEFLQADDFIAEQTYHRRMRYLHNRYMHTTGIVDGLEVTQGSGPTEVNVTAGMGIVKVDEDGEELGKEIILTNTTTINLIGGRNAVIYVVIEFDDREENSIDLKRIIERAKLRQIIQGSAPDPDNVGELILAKVTLNAFGTGIRIREEDGQPDIDLSMRLRAGMRGDIEATRLRFSVSGLTPSQWSSIQGQVGPKLLITSPLTEFSGNVTLGGNIDVNGTVDGLDISSHDHTTGKGTAIPWSALSAIPDMLIKAYVLALGEDGDIIKKFGVWNDDPNEEHPKPFVRDSKGKYTFNWLQYISTPLIYITINSPGELTLYELGTITHTSVTFYVKYLTVDPANLFDLFDPNTIMVFVI